MPEFAKRMDYMAGSAAIIKGLFGAMNDSETISFGGGAPASETLPVEQVNKIASEVITREGRGVEALQYGPVQGVKQLREIVAERRLSAEEYLRMLMEADTTKRQIRKNRYCLTYDNQYFEIDVYPFWSDKAIAEIELKDENEDIRFPKELTVIKEVTDDISYKNASLAKI